MVINVQSYLSLIDLLELIDSKNVWYSGDLKVELLNIIKANMKGMVIDELV